MQSSSNSSLITGGVSITVASVEPFVTWALNGFPHPIPETVPYVIAAGLVTFGHAAYNYLRHKLGSSIVDPPSPPAA